MTSKEEILIAFREGFLSEIKEANFDDSVGFRLHEEAKEKLAEIARHNGKNKSDIIRLILYKLLSADSRVKAFLETGIDYPDGYEPLDLDFEDAFHPYP